MATPLYRQPPYLTMHIGDRVHARHAPLGEDHEGHEHTLDVGSTGIIDTIDEGGAVHVVYWFEDGEHGDLCIVQVYSDDDGDLDAIEFGCRGPELRHGAAVDFCGRPLQDQAVAEGWAIIWSDSHDRWEIQRDDEQSTFATDDDALAHVQARAAAGSVYHRQCLEFVAAPA